MSLCLAHGRALHGLWFLFVLLCGLASAQAATDSSLPSYAAPDLHIPRIDVEAHGALDVTLTLLDADAMIFGLAGTAPASSAATPGATYDLGTGLVDIPVLRIGTANYAAKLTAIAGGRFQVISLLAVNLPGQARYQQMCAACHGADGRGGPIAVSLQDCQWCSTADTLAGYIDTSMPYGNPAACDAGCAQELATYLLTVFNTPDLRDTARTLDALSLAPDDATLRKAALHLVSRLPTDAEQALVRNQGEAGLRSAIDGMMTEAAFYSRLSEIFNDWLLTNRYQSPNGSEAAIGLLSGYPDARWYDPGEGLRDATYQLVKVRTNDSVAAEPLELINYVTRNELPATEILTADYMMVNGYSAKSYGITDVVFDNEWDQNEFRPARIPGLPHAGILTSRMFLNRYPTTATNRNRARARVVYDLFLDVDILGLDGVRPDGSAVDIARSAPTMENPDCVKCHSLLDPVASAFQNWSSGGKYSVPRSWYRDMFAAGFGGIALPDSDKADQTGWLAAQIAQDPRFDTAMVRLLYRGLTGAEPLRVPGAEATTADIEAYTAESEVLDRIKAAYVADGRKIKTLVREIVLSPYWRADGLDNGGFALVHARSGSARLLTPELLHRKIAALLGFEWRGPLDSYSSSINIASSARLTARQYYRQLYGGIDSNSVTQRLEDPNGLMAKVQERMANELACYAVPEDFLAAQGSRRLFQHVEASTLPGAGDAAIVANLQHLHRHLLGEELAPDSIELQHSYALFSSVQQQGRANVVAKTESTRLPVRCRRTKDLRTGYALDGGGLVDDPNYTLRAWIAVVAYLLSDYRFLYE
ncbi:MAG: c-type cytochrome [Gammaproteobacteria bacterium]